MINWGSGWWLSGLSLGVETLGVYVSSNGRSCYPEEHSASLFPNSDCSPTNWSHLVESEAPLVNQQVHTVPSRTKPEAHFLILLHSLFLQSVKIRFIMGNWVKENRTIFFSSGWKISWFLSPYSIQIPWFRQGFELSGIHCPNFPFCSLESIVHSISYI